MVPGFVTGMAKHAKVVGVSGNYSSLLAAAEEILVERTVFPRGRPPPPGEWELSQLATYWNTDAYGDDDAAFAQARTLVLAYYPTGWDDEEEWAHYFEHCNCPNPEGKKQQEACLDYGKKVIVRKVMGPLHGYWSTAKWNMQERQLDKVARPSSCHGMLPLAVERFLKKQRRPAAAAGRASAAGTQQQQQPAFVLPLRRALERAGVSAVDSQSIIDEELMNDWNRSHAERVDFRNSHSCRSGLHCLRRKTLHAATTTAFLHRGSDSATTTVTLAALAVVVFVMVASGSKWL
jgi:hypothetical protein